MAQVSYGTITITDTNDIESIVVEYARNQSTSSAPDSQTGGWSTTRPVWAQGYYIWQRTRIHKSGTDTSEDEFGTAVCITGSTGQTGAPLTVSSITYAVSTTETQPQDSSFTYTTVPTVVEGSWLWTKTEYSDGSKIYTKSKQGKSGTSVTVTKVEYQSGTSPTTAPTGSWNTSIPSVAEGNYLWTKTTYSDNNYSYTVAKQGRSGTSVTISSTSVKYQIGTSATTAPTGTWQDNVQATTTGQFLWTRTIVTYSDGSSTTSYSVSAHGATGSSVSVSSIKYAKSTTDSQPQDSSFGTTIPSVGEGEWLWTMTTYSNGSKMYTKSKSGQDGRSLTATETKYVNVASGTTQTQVEALAENLWVSNVPSYDSSKPDYWIRVKNTYDKTPTTEYIYYKDNATSESLYNSAMANSIAQSANENANGAMGQAAANIQTITRIWYAKADSTNPAVPTSHVTTSSATTYNAWNIKRPNANDSYPYYFYCDETCTGGGVYSWSEVTLDTSNLSQYQIGALTAKVKNFWWDSSGAHVASGKNGNEVTKETISTYGYHALTGLTGISFNYDNAKVVDLNSTTPSLDFYQPPTISGSTVTQGKKTMMLSANALRFYDPSDGTTEQAKLDTNGLVLSKGGIKAGTSRTNDFIYLSSANFADTISGHNAGTVSLDNYTATDWRQLIGTKFGVRADGTLYASNANISGTIAIGSGSTIDSGATVGGTSLSNIAQNASTGAQAASDLSDFETTVSNTYATQEALSDVEEQIPDVSGLASKTDTVKSVTTETQYRLSNSSTSLTGSGTGYTWSTTIPTWSNNKYLWTRIATTYTPISGTATTVYKPGTSTNEYGIYDSQLTTALSTASSAQTTANEAAPKTDAMYRTQRIYWRSTYNSLLDTTPTPQINQTWLTTSGSGYGNWSLTVPPMTVDIVNYIKLTVIDSAAKVDDLQEIQLVYASSNGSASYPTYNYNSVFGNSPIWEDNLENADGENIWMGIGVILESQPITSNNFATYFYTPVQINNLVNGTTFGSRGLTTTIEYCNSNAQNIQNLSDSEEWISTIPAWNNEKTNYYVKINTTVKFPYLFTALQTQTVNQYNGGVGVSCSCSEVLLDNTTTIIDGGSIITGTIDVNKLSAYDATIGQIKAGVIQGLDRKIDMSPDATGTSLAESFDAIKNTLVFQAEQIYFSNDTIESDVHNLLDSYVQNITIDTGSGGTSPYIQVGQSTGFYVKITNNRLSFMHGSTDPTESPIEIAYIDGGRNQLFIGQSVVLEEMDVGDPLNGLGQWAWTVHANTESVPRNNLTLKWLG